jgi:bifunctional DNA-binding transcriptional regulator/antitoxin component of YhaV-PrlF toxin-antitoxin module
MSSPKGEVVTVTKKGQATIPKSMRLKHRIGKKVLAIDTPQGVMFRPIPDPAAERGSLRKAFRGKSAREIMGEVRRAETENENKKITLIRK